MIQNISSQIDKKPISKEDKEIKEPIKEELDDDKLKKEIHGFIEDLFPKKGEKIDKEIKEKEPKVIKEYIHKFIVSKI